MIIRDATDADIPAITAIYNDAIAHTVSVWHDDVVDTDNRLAWLRDHQEHGYPVLVAELDGAVVGYARYGEFRHFSGYRYTMEHSVFIREDARRQGIGRALMAELIERARGGGVHVLVGAIEAGNTGSIALHRELGFEDAGVLREVGWKADRWLDLAFLTLRVR